MLNWILENDIFEDNHEQLQREITKAGMTYEVIQYLPSEGGDFSRFGPNDFLYGCLEISLRLKQESPQCIIYNTIEAYECTAYYPVFGELLLNRRHTMLPYGDLRSRADDLFGTFGGGPFGGIFVRPNSGMKTFTGLVMLPKLLEKDIEFIERYSDIPPDTLIVVAPARNIAREYRFVVGGQKVITGSLYRVKSDLVSKTVTEGDEVFRIAQGFLDKVDYNPDPLWVMDVCQTEEGEWCVLEIGCFSCAGLYACDLRKVVQAVGESVMKGVGE